MPEMPLEGLARFDELVANIMAQWRREWVRLKPLQRQFGTPSAS